MADPTTTAPEAAQRDDLHSMASWEVAKRLFDIVHKGTFKWEDAPWRSQQGFLLMANTGDYGHLSDAIRKGETNDDK